MDKCLRYRILESSMESECTHLPEDSNLQLFALLIEWTLYRLIAMSGVWDIFLYPQMMAPRDCHDFSTPMTCYKY